MEGRILYADDDESVRKINSRLLGIVAMGYEIEIHEDGTSLNNRLEGLIGNEGDVKLVVTDNNMPGFNGLELIKKYAQKLDIPFILYYGGVEDMGIQAVKDGAFGYMIKPERLEAVSELVNRALDSKK